MQIYEGRRVLRRNQLLQKIGIGRTAQYKLERAGDFPSHFLLTPRCAVWFEDEIDRWLDDRRAKAIAAAPLAALVYTWSKGSAKDKGANPLAGDVRSAVVHSLLGDA